MAKRKKIDKGLEDYEKFTSKGCPNKSQKVSKKQYNKDLNSYLCRLNNQRSIFLEYIGEPVKVTYEAPTAKIKLIGKIGKIVNIISDTLGNRIYELSFSEKGILGTNKLSKLNLTFSEDDIEFVDPEKFEQLLRQFSNITC